MDGETEHPLVTILARTVLTFVVTPYIISHQLCFAAQVRLPQLFPSSARALFASQDDRPFFDSLICSICTKGLPLSSCWCGEKNIFICANAAGQKEQQFLQATSGLPAPSSALLTFGHTQFGRLTFCTPWHIAKRVSNT